VGNAKSLSELGLEALHIGSTDEGGFTYDGSYGVVDLRLDAQILGIQIGERNLVHG
jgi:hypothetical protein